MFINYLKYKTKFLKIVKFRFLIPNPTVAAMTRAASKELNPRSGQNGQYKGNFKLRQT